MYFLKKNKIKNKEKKKIRRSRLVKKEYVKTIVFIMFFFFPFSFSYSFFWGGDLVFSLIFLYCSIYEKMSILFFLDLDSFFSFTFPDRDDQAL